MQIHGPKGVSLIQGRFLHEVVIVCSAPSRVTSAFFALEALSYDWFAAPFIGCSGICGASDRHHRDGDFGQARLVEQIRVACNRE